MEKKTGSRVNRRQFLAGTVGALGLGLSQACSKSVTVVKPEVVGGPGTIPPSEKLNYAAIGCGGKGSSDIRGIVNTGMVNLVALCDIDWRNAPFNKVVKEHPDVPRYFDFRVMFDELGDKIDAVSISTPDHTHAAATMAALKRDIHVFCQKPLTHNIKEARLVTEEARKRGLGTLMGIQGHASEGIRLVREWIEQGALGQVREVHVWTNRPVWAQGMDRPEGEDPVPKDLSWENWLGPAPLRPYKTGIYHRFSWRGWYDFGCGAIGDIACHSLDAPFWALKLGYPTSVVAESEPLKPETFPRWSKITFEFPARGDLAPVKLVWFDGKKIVDGKEVQNKPPRPECLEEGRNMGDNGQLFYGDDGALMCGMYAGSPRLIPETKMKDFLSTDPKKYLDRSPGHYKEFVQAAKGESKAGANFDYAGPLTELAHLGNVALRSQTKIEFDPVSMKVTNCEEPNQFIGREYREGWTL